MRLGYWANSVVINTVLCDYLDLGNKKSSLYLQRMALSLDIASSPLHCWLLVNAKLRMTN